MISNKYIVVLTAVFFCFSAHSNDDIYLQMLDNQILALESGLNEKYTQLKECEKTTKNFKIAGAITLGLTSAGIAANITLAAQRAAALKGGSGSMISGGKSSTPTNNAPQEEKDCDSLSVMCDMGIEEACAEKC